MYINASPSAGKRPALDNTHMAATPIRITALTSNPLCFMLLRHIDGIIDDPENNLPHLMTLEIAHGNAIIFLDRHVREFVPVIGIYHFLDDCFVFLPAAERM